jgi:hypothetical protein
MVFGIAGIPGSKAEVPTAVYRAPVTEHSRAAWLAIASELVDAVPPALLLGSAGSHGDLDAKLREARIDRDLFQRTAAAIRAEVCAECDAAEEEAVAGTLEDLPLPEGFHAPAGATDSPPRRRKPARAERNLVAELTSRLSNIHGSQER